MHPLLVRLQESLRAAPGREADWSGDPARAAVALAFRDDRGEPELLLIERARRDGDPWSGQIALPGGRRSPNDASLEATAWRETLEETGLDVRAGTMLGALDDLRPHSASLPAIVVTPYVAAVEPPPALVLNHEVAAAFWVPWSTLTDPGVDRVSDVRVGGATRRVQSLVIGEHIVWGMTERILRQMFERVGGRRE